MILRIMRYMRCIARQPGSSSVRNYLFRNSLARFMYYRNNILNKIHIKTDIVIPRCDLVFNCLFRTSLAKCMYCTCTVILFLIQCYSKHPLVSAHSWAHFSIHCPLFQIVIVARSFFIIQSRHHEFFFQYNFRIYQSLSARLGSSNRAVLNGSRNSTTLMQIDGMHKNVFGIVWYYRC